MDFPSAQFFNISAQLFGHSQGYQKLHSMEKGELSDTSRKRPAGLLRTSCLLLEKSHLLNVSSFVSEDGVGIGRKRANYHTQTHTHTHGYVEDIISQIFKIFFYGRQLLVRFHHH